jgi:hypothetical protein
MKLNIKWFSITTLIIGTIPLLMLFIWCSINQFGAEIVSLFESVHPSGGFSIIGNSGEADTFINRIPGIIINTAYTAIDFLILGFAFSSLYNFMVTRFDKKNMED